MPFWDNLYRKLKTWLGFPDGAAKRDFGVTPAVSRETEQEIAFWNDLYLGNPPWQTRDVISLNLPAAICREVARPTLAELEVQIEGGALGTYLAEQFRAAQKRFRPALETFLALGGGVLKPYLFGDKILVDYCGLNRFRPTRFNAAGECVGAVFQETVRSGERYVTRLENHLLENGRYTIQNRAYESSESGSIGNPVSLDTVPEWAELAEETSIDHVERPLFAYFQTPVANKEKPSSGVGVSLYASAVDLIRQADVQWERLQWEYKSGERKIFGERSQTNLETFGRDRLYAFGPFWSENGDLLHEFSPDFRDANLYAGFQNTLKQIEFNIGLAFGTISDPMSVERTATEVEATKQRMFTLIEGIKGNLEETLDNLIYAMSVYAGLYRLAPAGAYQVSFEWGDSVLEDTETKQRILSDMRNDVAAGLLRGELYLMKKYGVSEEEALAMMPRMEDMADEEQDEVE